MGFWDLVKKQEIAKIKSLEKELVLIKVQNDDLTQTVSEQNKTIEALNSKIDKLIANSLKEKQSALKAQYDDDLRIYKEMKREISVMTETLDSLNAGIYTPLFNYDDSEKYKLEMLQANKAAAEMVKQGNAVCGGDIRFRKKLEKTLLLGFNGVCENCISNVKWNNVFQCEERIKKTRTQINKAFENFGFYISESYEQLRLKELHLAYEYRLKQQREKEEQNAVRQMMREEEKVRRDIEVALIKADAEEKKYLERLEKASNTIESLQGEKLEKAMAQIAELEERLKEARANKERALSMAEQTRRGYVYVISNIGSFGENVYKIGLTRRLDPMDRVRELGDASVPFPFDVHAIIFSEDAPKLETALHREFDHKRVNMVNNRKEFFNVTLEEIEEVVRRYNSRIEFIKIPEAKDYRQTSAIQNSLVDSNNVEKCSNDLFALL